MKQSEFEQPLEQHPVDIELLPEYEPPRVVSYRGEEIVARLGPAQACNSFLGTVYPQCQP